MSQQNFMRNLRMTMPQYVTNTTSFGDAVKILKNKSIIVETIVKENLDFNKAAIEAATGDKISHTEEDDYGEPIYWSTENPYVNYYIGGEGNNQIIKYDGKTGERYPVGDLRNYDEPSNDDYEPDTDADYEEPRDDFDMAGDYNDGEFWEGQGEGDEDAMYDAMIKKIEDELASMQATNAQYDENKDKEFDEEEDEEEMYDAEYDEDEMFNPAYMNEAKKPNVEKAEDENLEEVTLGIFMEHACFPDKSYEEIEKIVKKNIKKNPNYYTNYKLTGIRDYELQTMDSSKPEDHQMKFYTEKTAVDTARGMQKVKMPKKEEKKKLKENKIRTDIKGQIVQVTNNDGVTFSKNDDAKAIDNGEKIKITGFKEEQGKVKALFSKGMFASAIDIDGLEKVVSASPIAQALSKEEIEELMSEVMNEYYDGRDNLIDPLAAEENSLNEEENLQQFATKLATQHNLILMPQPLGKAQLFSMYQKEKGNFGNKNGVMTYEPSSKVVNVLSNDEKIPEAVYAQFKADRGGNDQGFETKTFAEKDAQIAYFKNFQIAG
jgi:hypothetical protein